MRVLLAGASGLIGSALVASLRRDGHDARCLVRRAPRAGEFEWHPDRHVVPMAALDGVDAIVCLSGAPIPLRRLVDADRRRLRSSRIDAVRTLAEAGASNKQPPALVTACAVGYYGDTGDTVVDESAPPGTGFVAQMCRDWEAAAAPARDAGARVVSLRSGIVLSGEGGFVARVRPIVWLGVAGRVGSGRQFVPWISLDDEIAAIRFLLDSGLAGPVNLTAPNPVRNAEFVATMARLLHRPAMLAAPAFAVRLALGELGAEALGGQRAAPARLSDAGFAFRHSALDDALRVALA